MENNLPDKLFSTVFLKIQISSDRKPTASSYLNPAVLSTIKVLCKSYFFLEAPDSQTQFILAEKYLEVTWYVVQVRQYILSTCLC